MSSRTFYDARVGSKCQEGSAGASKNEGEARLKSCRVFGVWGFWGFRAFGGLGFRVLGFRVLGFRVRSQILVVLWHSY